MRLGILEKNITGYSNYEVLNKLFSVYDRNYKYKIVMLGDSITAEVAWNELLGIDFIANRGIGGDTTNGFIERLENIYEIDPEICFIMGGINDIHSGITVEDILSNFETIVEKLTEKGIKVIIQSTLYVSRERPNWEKINEAVDELNDGLQKICARNYLQYLNVNKILTNNGALDKEYTYDGVHLLGNGYNKWKEFIMAIIKDEI